MFSTKGPNLELGFSIVCLVSTAMHARRGLLAGSCPVPPCRVTNTGEEMKDPEVWGFDPDIIELDQKQIPQPELGPLERRVELTYEEALFSEDIDLDDTAYWFTEPPGGHHDHKLHPCYTCTTLLCSLVAASRF